MKNKFKILAGFILIIFHSQLMYAQNTKIDSLDNLLISATSDTARINLIVEKVELISSFNLDSAINLATKTLAEAQRIGFHKAEVTLRKRLVYNYSYKGNFSAALEQLNDLEQIIIPTNDSLEYAGVYAGWGIYYGIQSKYDSSIYFYEKSIFIYERNDIKEQLGRSYSNIAIGYQQKSNFPMALYYQQKSLKLREENENESGQAYTLVNIANTYLSMGDIERSEEAFLKSIELAKKTELKNVELYAYTNLSSLYFDEEEWQKSFDIAMKAAELGKKMGDQGIQAASLAKASRALVKMGQAEKARKISEKAIAIADSSGQPVNISQANASMGYLLLSEKNWGKAIPFYESAFEAVKDADIFTPNIGMLYKELSTCYENTGSYSKALKLYKQYATNSDSVWSKENVQKATELAMNFEFEKKEQSAKARQAQKDEIARTRQIALIIGLVLSIIIILGSLRAYYNKQKANTLLREQKKEIERTLSKLKKTQSQLIQSEKMASLGELTAGIAHEIQNPLNFVNNFSEVSNELIDEMNEEMEKGDLDEAKAIAKDVKQNLEKINHHGGRAEAIVKNMLQHSRSDGGVKVPANINKLADEYLRLAYHGLRAKDKSFNSDFKTDLDASIGEVNVIPQDIGRVILNLITNAFYAVDERNKNTNDSNYKPLVLVSTQKKGKLVEIIVKDNGNGIPDEIKDKIFQPFFTTKPTGKGTGLGLSMSYDIVTKGHGGKLKVESKEGEGTTFTIEIPV